MAKWQHHVTCTKCGDPSGLRGPVYNPERDVLVLHCDTCTAAVELVPLDRRARERRERVRAFFTALRASFLVMLRWGR